MEILDVVRESTNNHSLVKKGNHISFMLDINMYKTEGNACYSYVFKVVHHTFVIIHMRVIQVHL